MRVAIQWYTGSGSSQLSQTEWRLLEEFLSTLVIMRSWRHRPGMPVLYYS